MKNYEINYNENTIIATKAFLKEAGIYNSEAYNILKGLRADLPNFEITDSSLSKIAKDLFQQGYLWKSLCFGIRACGSEGHCLIPWSFYIPRPNFASHPKPASDFCQARSASIPPEVEPLHRLFG